MLLHLYIVFPQISFLIYFSLYSSITQIGRFPSTKHEVSALPCLHLHPLLPINMPVLYYFHIKVVIKSTHTIQTGQVLLPNLSHYLPGQKSRHHVRLKVLLHKEGNNRNGKLGVIPQSVIIYM